LHFFSLARVIAPIFGTVGKVKRKYYDYSMSESMAINERKQRDEIG
jgi:hypothetical protein